VLATLEKRMGNTLNVSGLVGLGLRTSMRNQLPCRIKDITRDSGTARVQLELPNGACLVAKVTTESAELLGLSVGMSALALCKATAVTIGTGLNGPASLNRIHGEVVSAPSSVNSGETSIALMPGLQLIGFSLGNQGLSVAQKVMAAVDESAVVIAIPG
jgi:molybdate transport system regulatory protein